MSSWKDDKDLGPWEFEEQVDKWGYLNNPRWQQTPTERVNYTGIESTESQIWPMTNPTIQKLYSAGDSDKHGPCGHWHKKKVDKETTVLGYEEWFQQSLDIYESEVLFVAMRYVGVEEPENGIVAFTYNVTRQEWVFRGIVSGGYCIMGTPNTARRVNGYSFYYGSWADNTDENTEYMRLHIFPDEGDYSYVDLWTMDYPAYTQTKFFDGEVYNTMDAHSSGLVACLCCVDTEAGVNKDSWAIKVSVDYGATWKSVYYFPTINVASLGANVRISADGTIYVAFLQYSPNTFHIYKSDDSGDSWSLVHTETLAYSPYDLTYSIDETGQYQYLIMRGSASTKKLYISSDYGSTWSSVALDYTYDSIIFSSNKEFVVLTNFSGAGVFKRSVDYGANWNNITPPYDIEMSWQEQQNYYARIAYTECGASFTSTPDVLGQYFLAFMYSEDNGATWSIIQSPLVGAYAVGQHYWDEVTPV